MSDVLKRAVIKEELVHLTGDYVKALILNQMIYWSQRVSDFDKFIQEEKERAKENGESVSIELTNGWIYKKAEDLAEETMLNFKKNTMRDHISSLVELGYLDQRRNPKNKMDRTLQYRVNIAKIQADLFRLGYSLEGYKVPLDSFIDTSSKNELRSSNNELRDSKIELRESNSELGGSKTEFGSSNIEQQYQRLQTEITSENTSDNNNVAVVDLKIDSNSPNANQLSLLKNVLGDQISDSSLSTWLKHGTPDQILKAWYKANEIPNVDDIGAYVTWLLKGGLTSMAQSKSKQTQPAENSHPFYEMMRAAQEAAATAEIDQNTEEHFEINKQVQYPITNADEVWAQVLANLESQLSTPAFRTWLMPLEALKVEGNNLVVKAPSDFHKDWIVSRYSLLLKDTLKFVTNVDLDIKLVI